MSINVDMVYICHYAKLQNRKEKMLEQLKVAEIDNYMFVELFDKDSWESEEIQCDYPFIDIDKKLGLNMNDGEKSLALKHAWIIIDACNNDFSSVLVLEDDAVLCDDFINKFNEYSEQLPDNWDVAWVGSCFNLREPEELNKFVYKTNRGSRCTHAFALSSSFLKRAVTESYNIREPSDVFYNRILRELNAENYWFQPPLALQNLDFCSSLNNDPNHKWPADQIG